MHLKDKIKAFFFLGVFGMLLMHQVFPHLHHEHDNVNHEVAQTDHGHSHDHDHDKNQDKKNGFFSFLFSTHTHISNAGEVLIVESTLSDYHKKKEFSKALDKSYSLKSLFTAYREPEKPLVYQPPNLYFNPYLSYLSLRGPPALG
jgi:zinc transporter ZupT